MGFLLGIFGNIKNALFALGALTIGIWAAKQKYDAYQAEDKLKTIENKIAKTNVVVAKQVAKAKAQAKEIESTTEVEVLRELKEEKKQVLKEMDEIETLIETTKAEKAVTGRKRGKKISIDA